MRLRSPPPHEILVEHHPPKTNGSLPEKGGLAILLGGFGGDVAVCREVSMFCIVDADMHALLQDLLTASSEGPASTRACGGIGGALCGLC
eukprot:1607728-Rhodomonas_salina.2